MLSCCTETDAADKKRSVVYSIIGRMNSHDSAKCQRAAVKI